MEFRGEALAQLVLKSSTLGQLRFSGDWAKIIMGPPLVISCAPRSILRPRLDYADDLP